MAIVLFDNALRTQLYPFTATRAVADLRCGIVTIKERWQLKTKQKVFVYTEKYLQPLYETIGDSTAIWVDASVLADDQLVNRILALQNGEALTDEYGWIAGRSEQLQHSPPLPDSSGLFTEVYTAATKRLQYPWQLFQWNDAMIREDFSLLVQNRSSEPVSHTNQVIQTADIFIEEGAKVEFCTLNSTTGPVYIGKDATIMEGVMIRGPFALGENSLLKMGTKIYGATTLGPYCMAGGEIKNTIMMGYSNKGHDGYLGDSVIGEWCNLGAGTSNSNIKNTGGNIKMWNAFTHSFENAGQKCGVVMGDYSRTAINSSINTGSMIGVCANVFGNGLLPKVVNDFSWGLNERYTLDKAIQDIDNWKQLKNKKITTIEVDLLKHIFENRS